METITFYSYKGGTGRTLLVAHAARYLAYLGKRVVAVDLDLEAPGLHYRLNVGAPGERAGDVVPERGVVDYLLASMEAGSAPADDLLSFVRPVAIPSEEPSRLWLMPAGGAPSGSYWKALTALYRMDPFLDAKGLALAAVLDLKARIEEELEADYLLIDSRTGITELGGIATSVLADKVVCLFVENRENLDGVRAVLQGLRASNRPAGAGPVEVLPVMSRARAVSAQDRDHVLRFIDAGVEEHQGELAVHDLYVLRDDPELVKDDPSDLLPPRPEPAPDGLETTGLTIGRRSQGDSPGKWRSGVYRDYRYLLSALAPADGTRQDRAWSRHEATQGMLEWLTNDDNAQRHRPVVPSAFRLDDIEEGVRLGGRSSRYADLVAYSGRDRSEALLAAEFVDDDLAGSTVWEWWQENTGLRCLVLFGEGSGKPLRRVFTRGRAAGPFVDRGDAWGVQWPLSFSALDDPGDRSVPSMLPAIQRGHEGFIPLLIREWQHAVMFGLHGGMPFRPGIARQILDGLAAVRDHETALRILRWTAPDPFERQYMGDGGGTRLEAQTTRELHAPLWWRLSTKAKIAHWDNRRDRTTEAGIDLLARELMGLSFDQDETLRDLVASQWDPGADGSPDASDVGDLARERALKFEISDGVPPELARRVLLDRVRQGEWTRFTEKKGNWSPDSATMAWDAAPTVAESILDDPGSMTRLLSSGGRISVVTTKLLGDYDSARSRVVLYSRLIAWCAAALEVDLGALENVVLLHETVHAMSHLGRDVDGRTWDAFALPSSRDLAFRPSSLHEGLAQYFTYRMIERLADQKMMEAFETLSSVQPAEYQQWKAMRSVPVERVRSVLMQARVGLADSLVSLR